MPVEAPPKPTTPVQPETPHTPVRIIPLPRTPSRPFPLTPIPPFTPIRRYPRTPDTPPEPPTPEKDHYTVGEALTPTLTKKVIVVTPIFVPTTPSKYTPDTFPAPLPMTPDKPNTTPPSPQKPEKPEKREKDFLTIGDQQSSQSARRDVSIRLANDPKKDDDKAPTTPATNPGDLLKAAGAMQPDPVPMRQSGSREEAEKVVEEKKKDDKKDDKK